MLGFEQVDNARIGQDWIPARVAVIATRQFACGQGALGLHVYGLSCVDRLSSLTSSTRAMREPSQR